MSRDNTVSMGQAATFLDMPVWQVRRYLEWVNVRHPTLRLLERPAYGGRGGHRRVNLVSLRSLATDEGGLAVQELAKRVGVIEDAGRIQRARIDALEKEVMRLKVQANP